MRMTEVTQTKPAQLLSFTCIKSLMKTLIILKSLSIAHTHVNTHFAKLFQFHCKKFYRKLLTKNGRNLFSTSTYKSLKYLPTIKTIELNLQLHNSTKQICFLTLSISSVVTRSNRDTTVHYALIFCGFS